MLETQTSNSNMEAPESFQHSQEQIEAIQDFLYGQTEIPFISFFKQSFVLGMFKNLGDIERVKKSNPTYASYIDRWFTESIRLKLVKILKDGDIQVNFDLNKISKDSSYNKKENNVEISKNMLVKICDISAKQINEKTPDCFSSMNYFYVDDDPKILNEVSQIYRDFYLKMQNIVEKSNQLKAKNSEKMHVVTIASCTIDEGVLNEI